MPVDQSTEDHDAWAFDEIIEAYKRDVDRTLIRENLKLTPDERVRKMLRFREAVLKIRGAARRRHG
jgi:hypothetical protein